MKKKFQIICEVCKVTFEHTAHQKRFCESCIKERKRKRRKKYNRTYYLRRKEKKKDLKIHVMLLNF